MLGGGNTADAYHITAPHPDGIGAAEAMRVALQRRRLEPDDVQYINAHGTSTELGDVAETKAIKKVFGDHAKQAGDLQHQEHDRPPARAPAAASRRSPAP